MTERQLLLMRHAKSSWNNANMTDHERPLNARGQRDAPAVAQYLFQQQYRPSRALISDAQRTIETFERMWAHIHDACPQYISDLYLGDVAAIRKHCAAVPPSCTQLLVIGHNPGWSHAVGWLSNVHVELKTAYVAVLTAHGDTWEELMIPGAWTLTRVISPAEAHTALSR